jgi:hypothetical protein
LSVGFDFILVALTPILFFLVAFRGAKKITKEVIEYQIAEEANVFSYLGYLFYLKTRI